MNPQFSNKLILTVITILLTIPLSTPSSIYATNSQEIRDLAGTDACFMDEITYWTPSAAKTTTKSTICNNTFILGGYDILGVLTIPSTAAGAYFETIYSTTFAHTAIYFTVTVWAIDSWDINTSPTPPDTFKLSFFDTSTTVTFTGPTLDYGTTASDICGRVGYKDPGPIRVFGKLPHSATSFKVQLINSLDENTNNESAGFRDLNILFVSGVTVPTAQMCLGPSSIIASTSSAMVCSCPEGQFNRGSVTPANCIPCHRNCASCFGPKDTDCYQCAPGRSFVNGKCIECHASCKLCKGPGITDCVTCQPGLFLYNTNQCIPECSTPFTRVDTPCINTCTSGCATFLDWNENCIPTCPFPLQQYTTVNGIIRCLSPCKTGEFLYSDGTCDPTCPAPLVQSAPSVGDKRCNFPCLAPQFLSWSLVTPCFTSCDPPLVQRYDRGFGYCEYPCSKDEYLNYDGACQAYCDPPYTQTILETKKLCHHPCPKPTDFIRWDDGTCQATCLLPYQQYSVGDLNYCIQVCPTGQFALQNGTCIASCDPPLKVQSQPYGNRCLLPCNNPFDYYDEETKGCKSTCNSFSIVERGLYFKCLPVPQPARSGKIVDLLLIAPSEQGSYTFIVLSYLTQYIRYMDVNFPPRLQALTLSQGRPILSLRLGMTMPTSLQEKFTRRDIPTVFLRNGLHSSFIVNYWQELTSLWIALGIGLLVFFANFVYQKLNIKVFGKALESVKFVAVWNYFLVMLATSIDKIVLYSALEFQSFQDESFTSIASIGMSILMIIASVGLLAFSFVLATKAKNRREVSQIANNNFLKDWEDSQTLYRNYRPSSKIAHQFYFIYIIRVALPMIITASGYPAPLVQAIFYLVISVLIIGFIAFVRPIESPINHFQLVLTEMIVFANNICLVILVALDMSDQEYEETSIFIGDIIILLNVCINLLLVAFLIAKVYIDISTAFKLRKQQPNHAKAALVHLLILPIQQGGMGFEEAQLIQPMSKALKEPEDHSISLPSARKEHNIYDDSQLASDRLLLDATRDGNSLYRDISPQKSIDLYNYSRQVRGIEPERKKTLLENEGYMKSSTIDSMKFHSGNLSREENMMMPESGDRGFGMNQGENVEQSDRFSEAASYSSNKMYRKESIPESRGSERAESREGKASSVLPSRMSLRRSVSGYDRNITQEVIEEETEMENYEAKEDNEIKEENERREEKHEDEKANENETVVEDYEIVERPNRQEEQISRVHVEMDSTIRSDRTLIRTVRELNNSRKETPKQGLPRNLL